MEVCIDASWSARPLTLTPDGMRLSGPDRSSMSTLGSRASSYLSVPSSRVPSMMSDPRSSVASTDSSFTHYSAASSRLSTASSRLSTISTASTPAPKNFACTFCDKALKSKPYWKSHEEEFHEQRLTWRCPDCEQIFHAGKRFREHHTKLHVSFLSQKLVMPFANAQQGLRALQTTTREWSANQQKSIPMCEEVRNRYARQGRMGLWILRVSLDNLGRALRTHCHAL